jgi:hypothetical protein
MKTFALFIVLLFFSTVPEGLNAQTTFQKLYTNTSSTDIAQLESSIPTKDGGLIMVGGIYGVSTTTGNIYVVKTDSLGSMVWAKSYDSIYRSARPTAIVETMGGGYAFTGVALDTANPATSDAFLIKTDDTGKVLWAQYYGGSLTEDASDIIQTADSGFTILASSDLWGKWLIKTDANGQILWSKTYNDSNIQQYLFKKLLRPRDGGYVIAGDAPTGTIPNDFFIMKTDSLGNFLWAKAYGGIYPEQLYGLDTTNDGGFVMCGTSRSFTANHGVHSGLILKVDSTGNIQWAKSLMQPEVIEMRCVHETKDSGYIAVGSSEIPNTAGDMCLVKLDENGNLSFAKHYGDTALIEGAWLISETNKAKGYMITGRRFWYFPGVFTGYYLLKTDNLGNTNCLSNSFNPTITSVIPDDTNITFTVFGTFDSSHSFMPVTASNGKDTTLCFSTGIQAVASTSKDRISIFPNPTTGLVTIKAPLPIELIEISNAFGEKVFSAQPQSPHATVNLQSLPIGIYFYSVKTKSRTERGKIVLQ